MAKERDWIGYANLASNVTQNVQLRHVNRMLEGLERAATERALDEKQQRLKEEGENRLRDYISEIDDNVSGLQRHLRERPRAALALARGMEGILERNNVSTASFHKWEDKDRVKRVLEGLQNVREQSAALLTAGEQEDAEKCAKYLVEMPALDQLVSVQSDKEKFQRERARVKGGLNVSGKQIEVEKLKLEMSRVQGSSWEGYCHLIGGLGLAFCVFWFVDYLSSPSPSDLIGLAVKVTPSNPLHVPSGVALAVFLISVVVFSLPFFSHASRRQIALTKRMQTLGTEVTSAKAELSRFDSESSIGEAMLEGLHGVFGSNQSSEAYEQMKREREAFIKKILGTSDAVSVTL
jgi:hypothetical protein